MSELAKALGDIQKIRRQLAHSTQFRGYGPATLALTAGFAVLGSVAQSLWLPQPARHFFAYVAIWAATAALSASVIAMQTVTRSQRLHSGMADEMLHMAVEQFLPCVAVGALLTVVLPYAAPAAVWMLPGLWQIIFSLGVFSSCRFLPRPILAVGVWYLFTGLASLSLGDTRALSPLSMGIAFAVGQLGVAAALYFSSQQQAPNEN